MKCPYCYVPESKVIDSRSTDEGTTIRRRRECLECGKRFTTYEKIESIPIIVVKKDGTRESFDREKIINGLLRACEKRPVSVAAMEKIVSDVESVLYNSMEKEIESYDIGELIMNHLKDVDEVAYVRFASVYRQFTDVNTFVKEIEKLLGPQKLSTKK